MVWMEMHSKEDVPEVLKLATHAQNSPFKALDRWTEILGSPPSEVWIRLRGVPLHVWCEETFSLLGDCVGSTVEVDPFTSKKEMMLYGRVKVTRDVNQRLPQSIYLWLDDLCVPIEVEMDLVLKVENA